MKQLMFNRDSDKSYEVRIYNAGDEHDWTRYGTLLFNDAGNWELWTGTDFSSEGSGLENSSDECVEYTSDLDETFDLIEQEISDFLFD